ncbi:hypothetical protein KL86PLE_40087 [uncultured Pleomorphomonas sp.]|uniref:Uncharacterized protein n=1 Tax=uncultured Pleomorphomonas sp. TaxID=442121 RepID=A0A212LFD7_9HYPH|nr:hypothetical protein KL86PLE_40087 [uncultured Pleomorphomonas sp.]
MRWSIGLGGIAALQVAQAMTAHRCLSNERMRHRIGSPWRHHHDRDNPSYDQWLSPDLVQFRHNYEVI